MLKYSFKRGLALNFTSGTAREAEVDFLEKAQSTSVVAPEDIKSFIDWIGKS